MNKKWLPHIIAVGAFVVFIVLGLACATMTPEERAADEANRITVRVRNTSSDWYWIDVKKTGSKMWNQTGHRFKGGDVITGVKSFTYREEGSYTVYYHYDSTGGKVGGVEKPPLDSAGWRTITVNARMGETVEVSIP